MEKPETPSQNLPIEEKSTEEKSSLKTTPKTPTTPTSNPNSNWWGSWISQAKEKSASVLEAVKNDLNEITTAVTETLQLNPSEEEIPSESSEHQQQQQQSTVNFNNMKQSISSSISTFFGTVTDALIPQLDDEDTSEAVLITSDDSVVLSGFTKHLADLQANDETYLEEPSKTAELAEKYRMWLEIVEQDQFTQQRVDKMLEQSTILNEKYNKFVPDTVSHMNFFKRYLFKKALLEDELANEERKRKEMQQQVTVIEKQPEAVVENKTVVATAAAVAQVTQPRKKEIDDLEIANFEISEEEQARLLAEYEQEIKEREKGKIDDVIEEAIAEEVSPKAKTQKSNTTITKKQVQSKSTVSATASTAATSKGKNIKDFKSQSQHQQKSSSNQQQQKTKSSEKSKVKKSDELPIEKDHFKKESESSTSDESWEKDFEI